MNRKSCHFEIFHLNFLHRNTVKILFSIFRQSSCKSFLSFTLKGKDVLRTRLVVREVRQCPDVRCNEVSFLMFERTFFGHWVKNIICKGYFITATLINTSTHCVYHQNRKFRVYFTLDDDYGQHSWNPASLCIKICQYHFLFLGQEEQADSWK